MCKDISMCDHYKRVDCRIHKFVVSQMSVGLAVATIAASIEHYANSVFASYQLKSTVEGASPNAGWPNVHIAHGIEVNNTKLRCKCL